MVAFRWATSFLPDFIEQNNLNSHRPQITQIDADVLSCQ